MSTEAEKTITEEKEKIVIDIGLDLSSTKCGICVLVNGVIYELLGLKFKTKDDMNARVNYFKEFMYDLIIEKYKANLRSIYIEDYLRQMMPGKSSAQSLFKLAIMNGTCCYMIKTEFGYDVKPIHVATARKMVVGTVPKERGGKTAKEYVFEHVMTNNADIKKIIDEYKGDKKKYPDIVYDLIDSFIIAKSAYIIEQEKEKMA
jgi:hypothetical protein